MPVPALYLLRVLGPLSGHTHSAALGLNSAGAAVGISWGGSPAHGVVWDSGATAPRPLPPLQGHRSSIAHGISDGGMIAGVSFGAGPSRATAWTLQGFQFDPGSGGAVESEALGIDALGRIVGAATNASGSRRAVLWEAGAMRPLLPGNESSVAWAVNDVAGAAVGIVREAQTLEPAFSVDLVAGSVTRIARIPAFAPLEAFGLNDAGHVVGVAASRMASERAFLWRGGAVTDLGAFGDRLGSVAFGINDAGLVVGASETVQGTAWRACLWSESEGLIDLNARFNRNGGDFLYLARAINSAGIIVGLGLINGRTSACLLEPVQAARFLIQKHAPPSVIRGAALDYSIIFRNDRQQPEAVVIRDTLPAGTRFVSASAPGTVQGSEVEWVLPAVPPGTLQEVQLQVQVLSNAGPAIRNLNYHLEDSDGVLHEGLPVLTFVADPPDAQPEIAITEPVACADIPLGADLRIEAEARDDQGVASVEFMAGDQPLGPGQPEGAGVYSFTWRAVPRGIHCLRAVATDTVGQRAASAPACVFVGISQAGAPGAYSIIELPRNFGGFRMSINAEGRVTAGQSAAIWLPGPGGGLVTLGSGSLEGAYGINRSGAVAGVLDWEATLWDPAGSATRLVSGFSAADAINDGGVIAGNAGPRDLFIFESGVRRPLNALTAGGGEVRAINSRRDVAGWCYLRSHLRDFRAVVWRNGGPDPTDLGTLGGLGSVAHDINDLGQVVGFNTGPDQRHQACRWARDGTVETLTTGVAIGINNLGQVVGYTGDAQSRAFLVTCRQVFDLNDFIPAGTGWRLQAATSINDSGQIVGWGTLNGLDRSFLLTPA